MIVEVNNKEYECKVVQTEEDKIKGLQGVKELKLNEGMLFIYDKPQTVGFWMKDTEIPLDIIFINEDEEVISVYQGEPFDDKIAEEDNVRYVLEVNINSGIKPGDEVDIDDESDDDKYVMKVLGPGGKVQMLLESGERIFSRPHTKTLIKWAKRSDKSKADKDYKRLGKSMFKFLNMQETQEPEYVDAP